MTNVPYLKSVTLTELAFQMIDKQALFSPEKGGRSDAPDFVVLFTDGDPTNLPESKVNTSVFLIVLLVTSFVYILRKRFLTCRII